MERRVLGHTAYGRQPKQCLATRDRATAEAIGVLQVAIYCEGQVPSNHIYQTLGEKKDPLSKICLKLGRELEKSVGLPSLPAFTCFLTLISQ